LGGNNSSMPLKYEIFKEFFAFTKNFITLNFTKIIRKVIYSAR